MGRQIMDDWTEFWAETLRTSRYFADKHPQFGLTNFELSMYSELCYALERFYKLNSLKLDKSIEQLEQELEQQINDDPDEFTSQSPI